MVPPGRFREFLRKSYGLAVLEKAKLSPNDCYVSSTEENWELFFTNHPYLREPTIYPKEDPGTIAAIIHELPSYFPLQISRDALVVDAGAFPGDFTVAAARLVPDGKVIAIEPHPQNREYLKRVIEMNRVADRVEVLPYALSEVSSKQNFVSNGTGSHLAFLGNCPPVTSLIETVTLDALLSEERRRPIIKMDIEGAELAALRGATNVVRKGAEFAIAAYHIVHGQPTYKSLQRTFSKSGYNTRLGTPDHLVLFAARD
jgi:FkbM family methyltransferase